MISENMRNQSIEEFNQERLDEKSENNQDEDLESMNN